MEHLSMFISVMSFLDLLAMIVVPVTLTVLANPTVPRNLLI